MQTTSPLPAAPDGAGPNDPRSVAAFRNTRLLVGCYLAIGVATFVAIVLLRDHSGLVNSSVWVRGGVVVVSSAVMYGCATRAAAGSHAAYRRLRVLSAVMVVAVAAIVTLPGAFPLWMKLDQGLCGLVLLGVAAITNGTHLRSVFSA